MAGARLGSLRVAPRGLRMCLTFQRWQSGRGSDAARLSRAGASWSGGAFPALCALPNDGPDFPFITATAPDRDKVLIRQAPDNSNRRMYGGAGFARNALSGRAPGRNAGDDIENGLLQWTHHRVLFRSELPPQRWRVVDWCQRVSTASAA